MTRVGKIALIALGVLVVLFFAQRLIAPEDSDDPDVGYGEFLELVADTGEVESVEIDQFRARLEVTPGPQAEESEEYEVAYLEDAGESLVALLDENEVPYEIESGGGNAASWFVYLLPFALFGAFWLWLARRLDRFDSDRG